MVEEITDEVVADYDIRSPASRTLLTVLGTLVAVGVLAGAVLGISVLMKDTRTVSSVIDLGGSAQVVVRAGDADIRVVPGTSGVVGVHARVTSGIRKTSYVLGRRGDEIKIASSCQTWLSPGCGVAVTLEVPKGVPVVVATTTGDIAARDVRRGVLTLGSTTGSITGRGLGVDELSTRTVSGDVSAIFATQPFAFKATTRDGDISATLPAGSRTYAVTARSTSGKVSSAVDSDKDGEGFVRATSRSGDITLRSD